MCTTVSHLQTWRVAFGTPDTAHVAGSCLNLNTSNNKSILSLKLGEKSYYTLGLKSLHILVLFCLPYL